MNELLPNPNPVPVPSPSPEPARAHKVTCEFCECVLGPSGEYVSLSEKAKTLRKQSETIEALREELAEAARLQAETQRERDEARSQLAPKVKRGPFG